MFSSVDIANQGLRTYDGKTQDMIVKPGRYELLYGSSAADKNLKKMEIELK